MLLHVHKYGSEAVAGWSRTNLSRSFLFDGLWTQLRRGTRELGEFLGRVRAITLRGEGNSIDALLLWHCKVASNCEHSYELIKRCYTHHFSQSHWVTLAYMNGKLRMWPMIALHLQSLSRCLQGVSPIDESLSSFSSRPDQLRRLSTPLCKPRHGAATWSDQDEYVAPFELGGSLISPLLHPHHRDLDRSPIECVHSWHPSTPTIHHRTAWIALQPWKQVTHSER